MVAQTSIVEVSAIVEEPTAHQPRKKRPPTRALKKPVVEAQIAVPTKDFEASPSSTVEIFGDSSLRKYSSKATQLGIRVKVDPPVREPEELLKVKLSEFVLVIPTSGLKSGTELLDHHMAEALKSEQFHEIRGVVKSYEFKGKNTDGSYRTTASVELTIAGKTLTVPVDAVLSVESSKMRIRGEKSLLMTDFGIVPPTLMLGTIKTANEITIRFNLLLGMKSANERSHL